MDKRQKLEHYFKTDSPWHKAINHLRAIVLETELTEDWKWNFPTYTYMGKNVVGLASHKTHYGLWFFQGVFLKDTHQLLRNAQEGKTKALRSLHFTALEDLDPTIIKEYVLEAIQNCKDGKQLAVTRKPIEVVIPKELAAAMDTNTSLSKAFNSLSPGKQREYAEHIASAKQEVTRLRRLEKCIPMILSGAGLNDKYKKN